MRYIYDDANRLDRIEHFNAMETDYTWDAANRLTGIAHNGPTNLVAYNFVLDANGNRTRETISPGPVMPGTLPSDDTSFAYNTPRNRLNTTSKPTYHYDQGQLTGNDITVANQYTYDDEGQLTGKGTKAYTFDDAHRLVQRGTDAGTETYVYDGVGNRIRATRGSAQAHYIYDAAGNLLAQANASGGIQRYYIYGAGLAAMEVGGNYYTYHFDGTGHAVAVTDKTNLVTHKYAYSPYGKVLGQVEPAGLSQPFKYAGQVGILTETDNLYYMRARYYDAETGRFISEDPAGFIDGPNLYAYVGGNPVSAVDPTGQYGVLGFTTGVIVGGISGYVGARASGGNGLDGVFGAAAGAAVGGIVGAFNLGATVTQATILARTLIGAGVGAGTNVAGQSAAIYLNPNLDINDFSPGSVIFNGVLGGGTARMTQVPAAVTQGIGNIAFDAVKGPIYDTFLSPKRCNVKCGG